MTDDEQCEAETQRRECVAYTIGLLAVLAIALIVEMLNYLVREGR